MDKPTLDAAALDRWAGLVARIRDHADGERPYAEVYDDDLSAFIAQARLALSQAERIAELEAELAAQVRASNASLVEMASHANALRDALEELRGVCVEYPGECAAKYPTHRCAACQDNAVIDAALASTPAADLAAHDAEVRYAAFSEVLNLMDATSIGSAEAEWDNLDARIRALAAQEVKP